MKQINWQFKDHKLIGKRVCYIGKNNLNLPIGTLGTIVAVREPLGKGKRYSASVQVKPDDQTHLCYETAYPFTTWALTQECPDCGSQNLNAPPIMPDDMHYVCCDCGNWF